jgi:hypothetical protein
MFAKDKRIAVAIRDDGVGGLVIEIVRNRIVAHGILSTGNGERPVCMSCQLGFINVTPFPPQSPHRPLRRKTSLDAFAPHRMMNGAKATGAPRPQARQ